MRFRLRLGSILGGNWQPTPAAGAPKINRTICKKENKFGQKSFYEVQEHDSCLKTLFTENLQKLFFLPLGLFASSIHSKSDRKLDL